MSRPSAPTLLADRVRQVIESQVNPVLAQDNGYASLTAVDGGVAVVRMEGMCAHCPNAQISFQAIVRRPLLHTIPELRDVRPDESGEDELLQLARQFLSGASEKEGQA